MFDARGANENSSLQHFAEMVALLGPPPRDFLRRSTIASKYFDEHGPCFLRSSDIDHLAERFPLQVSAD